MFLTVDAGAGADFSGRASRLVVAAFRFRRTLGIVAALLFLNMK